MQPNRNVAVTWKPISLLFKNEPPEGSDYYGPAMASHRMLRVLEAVRDAADSTVAGNDDVLKLYWEFGSRIHHDKDVDFDLADALSAVGLDTRHAAAGDDESLDDVIRISMKDGLGLTGEDVGTPIIATTNSQGERVGYFGPVITKVPPTGQSVKMWDALMAMMDVDGFFELKKTRTHGPDFGPRPDPI